MYLISQIIAGIGLFLNILSRFLKKQSTCLLINTFSCFFQFISNILLLAFMGAAGLAVSIARSFVFYYFSKNNLEKKLWVLLLFVLLQLCTCFVTSMINGFVLLDFILIFFKGSLYTYGAWQQNITVFRAFGIISSLVAIIYYMLLPKIGYVNILTEVIAIIVLVVIMIKEYFESRKQTKENNI